MRVERVHIVVFLGLAALVWWLVLLGQGTSVTADHARPFGAVVAFLAMCWVVLDRFLWRQPWLQGWLVHRPDLRGTWRVEVKSSYKRPGTEEPVPTIVCFMGVDQTLSTLQMHLMTSESDSWFIADKIQPSPNDRRYQVIGVYTNEPCVHLRGKRVSEMHHGAIIIETHGRGVRPAVLTAKYWTDRKTTGTMEFSDRIDEVHTRYADAAKAFDSAATPEASGIDEANR